MSDETGPDDLRAAHAGGNAEDCPACGSRKDLPYPFICPGTGGEPALRKTTTEYLTDLAAYASGIQRGRNDQAAEVLAFMTAAHERAEWALAERDRLKATLAEVLAVFFTVMCDHTGQVHGYLAPAAAIHPDDFDRWRAALDLPAIAKES